ncbi:MAG: HAMP domain-containing protein, partial [Ignavibacteriales bacterium]|nr:HAMP domain-containing protein [Ignavibacteriales bacterium]
MFHSIRAKMLVAVLPVILVFLVLGSIVLAFYMRSHEADAAYKLEAETAKRYARQINVELEKNHAVVSALETTLTCCDDLTRYDVNRLVRSTLEDFPQFLACYVTYELGAFDGRDEEFMGNTDAGSSEIGRLAPFWYWIDGELTLDCSEAGDFSGDYYVIPRETKKDVIVEPYFYAFEEGGDSVLMISHVFPLLENGVFEGIVGADVSIDYMYDLVKDVKPFGEGYAAVVSEGGAFVAHPDRDLVGVETLVSVAEKSGVKEYTELSERVFAGEGGFIEMRDEHTGEEAVVFYEPIGETNWATLLVVPKDAMLAAADELTLIVILVGLALTALISFAVVVTERKVTAPILRLNDAAHNVASGDYDVNIDADADDEVGELAASFQNMIAAVRQANRQLSEEKASVEAKVEMATAAALEREQYLSATTDKMRDAIGVFADGDLSVRLEREEGEIGDLFGPFNDALESVSMMLGKVRESIEETTAGSHEITNSARKLAEGSGQQSDRISETASAVEEMAATIAETTTNASRAAESARSAGDIAAEGGEVVKRSVEGMRRIEKVVKNAAETVRGLGERSEEIGGIARVIDEIADQTNLLALNAAIEAARAGEQGRGFAVVADEVRKLAERTTTATKEIARTIRNVREEANVAVKSIAEGATEVERGVELAE